MAYDVVIIGSGPGGYVAAIRAGQSGLKTAIVESESVGGMCLNWGCIPTKALLESSKRLKLVQEAASFGVDGIDPEKVAFNWTVAVSRSNRIVKRLTKGVEFLLKKNGVEIVTGRAVIKSAKQVSVANRLLETDNIVIATGSTPGPLPDSIPPEVTVEIKDLVRSKSWPQRPVVVGQGPHAVELAQFFRLAGREVSLVIPDEKLLPYVDPYLIEYVRKIFNKSKIDIHLFKNQLKYDKGEIVVGESRIPCDAVINASLRQAVVPESKADLEFENGFLRVDDFLRTNIESIYAVGDVNGRSIFAHAASAQGLHAVNAINGKKEPMNFSQIPFNMYTYPEMAQVGAGEPELKKNGVDYQISEFPLSANGKALTEGHSDGLVRILSDKKYGEVLGVQIVADHATDMIAEAAAIMQIEGTVFDVAATIHAHPTISEIFMEAGFAAFDQPIHK